MDCVSCFTLTEGFHFRVLESKNFSEADLQAKDIFSPFGQPTKQNKLQTWDSHTMTAVKTTVWINNVPVK